MEDRLGALRVVLCRPRNPQNLGAAARALRCAGISRWAVVDPRTLDFEAARRVAVHAEELLDRPRICSTLSEALSGCALSVGTTARARPERPLLAPREAAEKLAAARGDVALVFGDERSGLTSAEVDAVDLLSSIPSDPAQPSWNLAQAVAIYAYEFRMATRSPRATPTRPAADPAALAAVDRTLAEATRSIGKPGLRRRLFKALARADLSPREAPLWTLFFRAIGSRR
ncbi:MAG TPA: RNA methyltransferase, partial [Myxococcales bacterium]|nr:RNA methyltransferase [Myxococcales bacterium]